VFKTVRYCKSSWTLRTHLSRRRLATCWGNDESFNRVAILIGFQLFQLLRNKHNRQRLQGKCIMKNTKSITHRSYKP